MTKEQEEAIEYFKKHIKYFEEQIKFIEATDCDYYDEELELYQNRVKQFNTVLSMLEEKDKTIDLMSKQLAGLAIFNIDKDETLILSDKEEVKQYYENEAKELINK